MKLLILSALLCGVLAWDNKGRKYGYGPYGGYGYGGHAVANVRIGGYGYGTVSGGYGPLGAYGGSLLKKDKADEDISGHGYGHRAYGYGGPLLKKEKDGDDDEKTGRRHGYGGYGHGVYGHGGYKGLFQKVSSHYGNTAFAYNDGLSTRKEHIAYDGSRVGSYSVMGADGKLRTVRYKAGKDGFQLLDDSGVVTEDNVARAAELAKLTPVAPEVPDVPDVPEVPEIPEVSEADLSAAPTNAPEVPDVPEVPEVSEDSEADLPVAPTNDPEVPEVSEVPEVPEADLPVAPTNAPDYGKRNEDVYTARKNAYAHGHHGRYYGGLGYGHGGYGYGGYGYRHAPVSYSYSVKKVAPVYSYKSKVW